MGKRSRARIRREVPTTLGAADAVEARAFDVPQVHVTVAALPSGADDLELRHETELVKAALLYADRVTLASPKALMLGSLCVLCAASEDTRLDAMADIVSVVDGGLELANTYRRLRANRRHLSPHERLLLAETERILRRMGDETVEGLVNTLDRSGLEELAPAIEAGLLDIHPLGVEEAEAEDFVHAATSPMRELLAESVSTSATSLPLFDTSAGDLLEAMVREGQVVDPARAPGAEAGAAGRLVGRLEAFPSAAMDEILDLRHRFERPLVRFRAAMGNAATEFHAAAWEAEFAVEVDRFYRTDVAPAVQEIEEALEDLGAKPTLLRLASKDALAAGTKLGLTAAAVGGVAHLPALLFGAPAAALTAVGASEASTRRAVRAGAERNSFYFLYETASRLGASDA